jgi:hypothetical protein
MVQAAKGAEQGGWRSVGRDKALADAAWAATAMGLWLWLRPLPRTLRVLRHLLAFDAQQAPHHAALVREVFGRPIRPRVQPIGWRTAGVIGLARQVYDGCRLPDGTLDPTRLAALADAVEDAGGRDATELLAHLRSPGPHVHGCWVLDLLLGKE